MVKTSGTGRHPAAARIAEEVVQHLTEIVDAAVEISLEIYSYSCSY
jgi:hypothetical protein